jgi:hypothetical protein
MMTYNIISLVSKIVVLKISVVLQREVKVLNKSQTLFSANFRPLGLYQVKRVVAENLLKRVFVIYSVLF